MKHTEIRPLDDISYVIKNEQFFLKDVYKRQGQYVHPTFLYESLWCFALFWFLLWLDKRRAFPGQIACLYGMLYSLERGLVEQLRTDSLMIGSFKQAQVLSFFVFVLCLALYIILRNKRKRS